MLTSYSEAKTVAALPFIKATVRYTLAKVKLTSCHYEMVSALIHHGIKCLPVLIMAT